MKMAHKSKTCFKKDGEPLSAYQSRIEAEDGAFFVRFNYGTDLIPYQCPTCSKWHLSPPARQTPSKECSYCIDSNGKKKELYESEESAHKRAEIIKIDRGTVLRVYKCPHNEGWHLTKNQVF
jgi:hypothetical protein